MWHQWFARFAVFLALGVPNLPAQTEPETHIALRCSSFDPLSGAPQLPKGLQAGPDTGLWVVQFVDRPTESGRAAIVRLGGEVCGFIPHRAHLVRMSAGVNDALRRESGIRWVGPYHPGYRIMPELLVDFPAIRSAAERRYNIVVVNKRTDKPRLMDAVERLGGTVTHAQPGSLLLEVSLTGRQLLAVARLDEVLWIEAWTPTELDMDNVRTQTGAGHIETVAGYTGQQVNGHVYEGLQSNHPDFSIAPTSVLSCNTAESHGHCTAGIVFGNGSSAPEARGLAPDATPFFTSFLCVNAGLSRWQVIEDLVNNHEVMFSTSSWGNALSRSYTAISADCDDIIFDHGIAWTQSQSNSGNQFSRPQAWAKNIFSVGAVHHGNNSDPADDSWQAGNASTGPAEDGRIKPDFCAFYDAVWTSDRTGLDGFDPGDSFAFFGGTSAATPVVAGTNALAIQMYTDGLFGPLRVPGGTRFQNRPNFTTLKALQIVGATPYAFSAASVDNRREHQGWGVPNLQSLYEDRSQLHIVDETDALEQGESIRYEMQVPTGRALLKVAMTFADPAANPAAALHRVNDLSLRVTAPDGFRYWGNQGLSVGNTSLSGGSRDTVDTVECVFIENPTAGLWRVDVVADLVVVDTHLATQVVDADFGLVVRGGAFQGLGHVGTVTSYGVGCLGSAPSPPEVCTTINASTNISAVSMASQTGYALQLTAATAFELTGFELYAHGVTSSNEQLTAGIYLPDPVSGLPSTLVSSGTLTITPTSGWSTVSLQPVHLSAGQTYLLCFQTGAFGPVLWQASSGGSGVPFFTTSGGSWSQTPNSQFEFLIRLQCQPLTTMVPRLSCDDVPDMGFPVVVQLDDALANAYAAIYFGGFDTHWLATALPYSLNPLGGGNCTVFSSGEVFLLGATDATGHYEVTVYIPHAPAFLGFSVFCQSMITDPEANDLGLVTTNALELVVGN